MDLKLRSIAGVLIFCSALLCTSCETGTQPKAVVPPTPAPQAVPAPVLEPQTVVRLPPAQSIPPEAIPPRPPIEYPVAAREPGETVEEGIAPKVNNKPPKKPKSLKRPAVETAPEAAPPVQPPVVQPPVAPADDMPPPTLSAAGDQAISREQVNSSLASVQTMLTAILARKDAPSTRQTVARIRSFVRLSEQARERGDFRQADILAQRALALARDLTKPQ